MWYRQGDLAAARTWFYATRRRVSAYAPALGRLAEIDTAQGAHQAAIDRLRPRPCPRVTTADALLHPVRIASPQWPIQGGRP